ncbi:hypothetical protein AYI70_g10039 [Smittium culicis]|uniref:Uncharacterized protein n=1 Tax=Smittium culicis TaxID=133412 RepID=A0A1R1X8E9_9FUNG|nr:hypothetical protein AYI70_g10039 [Smittium culicis]
MDFECIEDFVHQWNEAVDAEQESSDDPLDSIGRVDFSREECGRELAQQKGNNGFNRMANETDFEDDRGVLVGADIVYSAQKRKDQHDPELTWSRERYHPARLGHLAESIVRTIDFQRNLRLFRQL